MKICVIKRKTILIMMLVVTSLLLAISLWFANHKNRRLAVETSIEEAPISDFVDKVRNLTKGQEKIAYLTFDDGPNKLVTPKILEILKEENITATFFVIGKNVAVYPELVKQAYEEGHYIANHSYYHNNTRLYQNEKSFIDEIQKTDIEIGKAIGNENYHSYLFRFPNGYMAPQYHYEKEKLAKLLEKMNYAYIDWNCLSNDSMKKYTKEQLLENLKKSAKDKNTLVILMHDTKDVSDSSVVLKDSIRYLKEQGYQFENFYHLN